MLAIKLFFAIGYAIHFVLWLLFNLSTLTIWLFGQACHYVDDTSTPSYYERHNQKWYDRGIHFWPWVKGYDYSEKYWLFPLAFLLLWPAAYPMLFVWLGLYALRGFVRFRKKVDSVLDNKSDKGHVH